MLLGDMPNYVNLNRTKMMAHLEITDEHSYTSQGLSHYTSYCLDSVSSIGGGLDGQVRAHELEPQRDNVNVIFKHDSFGGQCFCYMGPGAFRLGFFAGNSPNLGIFY